MLWAMALTMTRTNFGDVVPMLCSFYGGSSHTTHAHIHHTRVYTRAYATVCLNPTRPTFNPHPLVIPHPHPHPPTTRYDHFYVLYTTFWKYDSDGALEISQDLLASTLATSTLLFDRFRRTSQPHTTRHAIGARPVDIL